MDNGWWVYILSCADGSYYTGSTNNLNKRFATHNAGKGAKYTRGRLPVKLVWSQKTPHKSAALKLEHQIKALSKANKKLLISADILPPSVNKVLNA